MLAPPFTRENAADNARKAVISREKNRQEAKLKLLLASEPSQAQTRVKLQIDKVLKWMENSNSKEDYGNLVMILDRLWNKAFPTQGAVKSNRREKPSSPQPIAETPQAQPSSSPEIVVAPAESESNQGKSS